MVNQFPQTSLPELPITKSNKIARTISNVGNPAILMIIAQVLAAVKIATPLAWQWAGFCIAITTLLPFSFIVMLSRKGKVSDIDIYFRHQRTVPYLITIGCTLLVLAVMWLGMAPLLLVTLVSAGIIQNISMFIINLKWKISAHAAGAATFSLLTVYFFGPKTLPIVMLVPMIIWARVRLRRHTLMQTIAGASLGIAVLSFCLFWLQRHFPY